MAIIVLDKCINTIVIGIKPTTIDSTFTNITIGFIELNLDSIRVETKNAMTSAISATISQSITLIDCVLTDTCDDIIPSREIDIIVRYIYICP